MKKQILSIVIPVIVLSLALAKSGFGQQTPSLAPQRSIDEASIKTMPVAELVGHYRVCLHNGESFDGTTAELIRKEAVQRNGEEVDSELQKLFRECANEETRQLSAFPKYGEKRPSPMSGQILHLLGKRGGKSNVEFILSQTNSPYPVVRGTIASSLGQKFFSTPENEQYRSQVFPLLYDENPDVVADTLGSLWSDFLVTRRDAAIYLDELVRAEGKVTPGKKRANDRVDPPLEKCFQLQFYGYQKQLLNARNKASAADKEKVDELLRKIEERNRTRPAQSGGVDEANSANKRKADGDKWQAMSDEELIQAYKDALLAFEQSAKSSLLYGPYFAVRNRKGDHIDTLLTNLFAELVGKDIQANFEVKKPRSACNSELVLNVMGERPTDKNIPFILALTNSPYARLRGRVASALKDKIRLPEREPVLSQVLVLLNDEDPDVVQRTTDVLVNHTRSKLVAQALLQAEQRTPPEKMVISLGQESPESLKAILKQNIQSYRSMMLTNEPSDLEIIRLIDAAATDGKQP